MEIRGTFITITTLSILILFLSCTQTASAATVPQAYTNFIKTQCNVTTYQSLCIKTLSPYAASVKTNPLYLCNIALNVAIRGAKNVSSAITKMANQKGISPYEASAIKDCISDIKDAIYKLKGTLSAMGHLRDHDRDFEWSNAKARASAAITDAETCKDGFSGRRVNPALKKKIASLINGVEELSSNALSLINHLY